MYMKGTTGLLRAMLLSSDRFYMPVQGTPGFTPDSIALPVGVHGCCRPVSSYPPFVRSSSSLLHPSPTSSPRLLIRCYPVSRARPHQPHPFQGSPNNIQVSDFIMIVFRTKSFLPISPSPMQHACLSLPFKIFSILLSLPFQRHALAQESTPPQLKPQSIYPSPQHPLPSPSTQTLHPVNPSKETYM